jgi:hypothetical protein
MTKRREGSTSPKTLSHISLDYVPFLFYWAGTDFKLAIERNRAPLLVEVLKLVAMIGLAEA